ncbi:TlpA disulfide reductase family protein [Flavobacterium sp.]|uniref:TlpA family protein disulfide reductase n=1 Tax=Flavobacterium sp. TaxID=239 RepID=UPI0025C45E08|nr:TlpA disulfide reductase family protein [Flavobacterium sp.]
MKIKLPDDGDLTNSVYTYIIDEKSNEIVKITAQNTLIDQVQYNEWLIADLNFSGLSKADLKNEVSELTKNYSVTDFSPPSPEDLAPIAENTLAPRLTGDFYTGEKFNLENYKGKPVILDFWYIACYPCQKSIPQLSKLAKKYQNRIHVIGANATDASDIGKAKIPAFIKRTKMDYPIVFVSREAVKEFRVSAFPTLYLIDKNGMVRKSLVGFSEDAEPVLDATIEKMLME